MPNIYFPNLTKDGKSAVSINISTCFGDGRRKLTAGELGTYYFDGLEHYSSAITGKPIFKIHDWYWNKPKHAANRGHSGQLASFLAILFDRFPTHKALWLENIERIICTGELKTDSNGNPILEAVDHETFPKKLESILGTHTTRQIFICPTENWTSVEADYKSRVQIQTIKDFDPDKITKTRLCVISTKSNELRKLAAIFFPVLFMNDSIPVKTHSSFTTLWRKDVQIQHLDGSVTYIIRKQRRFNSQYDGYFVELFEARWPETLPIQECRLNVMEDFEVIEPIPGVEIVPRKVSSERQAGVIIEFRGKPGPGDKFTYQWKCRLMNIRPTSLEQLRECIADMKHVTQDRSPVMRTYLPLGPACKRYSLDIYFPRCYSIYSPEIWVYQGNKRVDSEEHRLKDLGFPLMTKKDGGWVLSYKIEDPINATYHVVWIPPNIEEIEAIRHLLTDAEITID